MAPLQPRRTADSSASTGPPAPALRARERSRSRSRYFRDGSRAIKHVVQAPDRADEVRAAAPPVVLHDAVQEIRSRLMEDVSVPFVSIRKDGRLQHAALIFKE